MNATDFIVIGAGIAGAATAWELSRQGRVVVLEKEEQPGYHATGRSAAIFTRGFGDIFVRRLCQVGEVFLDAPPTEVSEVPLMERRGFMRVIEADDLASLGTRKADLAPQIPDLQVLDFQEAVSLCPILREDRFGAALHEPSARSIDVHGLLWGYLGSVRRRGGVLHCDAEVMDLAWHDGKWEVRTSKGSWRAPVVVNAAGAWADEVARRAGITPLGLTPLRRTAFTVDGPDGVNVSGWPMVKSERETLYFKPESGRLMVSPMDEIPQAPGDARPRSEEVALAAQRLEGLTTLQVKHVAHRWAGLRSVFPDRRPVAGWDPGTRGFLWVAGQGGAGIKIAPALALATAALATGAEWPGVLERSGIGVDALAPGRVDGMITPDALA